MPTVHLLIKGKVQGVFYRASAVEIAQELGVTGWVKNTAGGHVEMVAAGSEAALQKLTDWCRCGPADAAVTSVQSMPLVERAFDGFRIRRD